MLQRLQPKFCYSCRNGGYIFDNFPQTREQWLLLIEKGPERGIMPDDVIYLRDESENGDYLIKRLVAGASKRSETAW